MTRNTFFIVFYRRNCIQMSRKQKHIKRCFGSFDGHTYDVEGLSPVQALGKVSALKMLVTERVGDPEEDETMEPARPRLSEMNSKGLLTTNSQMGKKEVKKHPKDGSYYPSWQRAYVDGVMPRHLARKFHDHMEIVGGVVVFSGATPGGEIYVDLDVPVTIDGDRVYSYAPMAPLPDNTLIGDMVLPDVASILRHQRCKDLVVKDAILVRVVDTEWGRPFWLFDKIIEVLDKVNDPLVGQPYLALMDETPREFWEK